MDFEQARFNMIEQQIRTWDVLDPTVLELLFTVRREDFVPPQFSKLAFADMEIPLGYGEYMLAPKLEARLLQEAALQREDQVLEVGTGSGYMAALATRLARHVYSVEIVPELSEQARAKFQAHAIANVTAEIGDAAQGWASHAPYDVILVTGSLPIIPEAFERSLAPGGRLLAVVGDPPVMSAQRIRRTAGGGFAREILFETCIKALRNAPQPERFVF
jgi:protein-L-isoaspartate(D-aspartate) O-methyltransferase